MAPLSFQSYQSIRRPFDGLPAWAPVGTMSGEEVLLRFELDSSGSATKVESKRATSAALGDTAVRLTLHAALAGDGAEVQRVAGLILANEDGEIIEPEGGETMAFNPGEFQF